MRSTWRFFLYTSLSVGMGVFAFISAVQLGVIVAGGGSSGSGTLDLFTSALSAVVLGQAASCER